MQYSRFLGSEFSQYLQSIATPVEGVPGLTHIGASGGLETVEALRFLQTLSRNLRPHLQQVLKQRELDRTFIDERVRACVSLNKKLGIDFTDPDYHTVLGHEDSEGRVVVGPLRSDYQSPRSGAAPVAPIPPHLQGSHVTLFGPPDDAKLSINAMNAFHRKLAQEPSIVETLLNSGMKRSPPDRAKWGADDEDSKTPLREDLIEAGKNLSGCFDGTLRYVDSKTTPPKSYQLAEQHLIQPIKRFPGLALPCPFLFDQGEPMPLHLYDFALHLFHHWNRPEALTFYVPKLENEFEAQYVREFIHQAEQMIQKQHSTYQIGTVRLMIVLENPRAIFRTHEIIDALYPYFAGASLGWHDFLASTARLFKEDPNYRIPVKADPNIVIRCIKASHDLLNEVVGSRGGIRVGGMYGVLPQDSDPNSESFQLTLKGFFKDVLTQLKRGLDGFWIAHPDFLRIGLATVEAFRQYRAGQTQPIETLLKAYLQGEHQDEMIRFLHGPDIQGFSKEDPIYSRYLIVAHSKESQFVPNHDLEEVRYNIFQSLQYLTDWLCGNGCVALPAHLGKTPVRVMDDLATAERSRWEVWHEVKHGRVSHADLVRIAHEELRFIRKDLSDSTKKVQVQWNERTSKWYPIALELMLQLMSAEQPPEFATEYLLPFTVPSVREQADPLAFLRKMMPTRYQLPERVRRYHRAFAACGSTHFAQGYTTQVVPSLEKTRALFQEFTQDDIVQAASFHGDIGESAATLDSHAASEQSTAAQSSASIRQQLLEKGAEYLKKFGFKFLISAKGKTAETLLNALQARIQRTHAEELQAARDALFEITLQRIRDDFALENQIEALRSQCGVNSLQLAVCSPAATLGSMSPAGSVQSLTFHTHDQTRFQLASLSKTLASSFAIEVLKRHKIGIDDPVAPLLRRLNSPFELPDQVTVRHLMNHQALNMHYVKGISLKQPMPDMKTLLTQPQKFGYEKIELAHPPGTRFQYSGGGFIVLQHLIELLEGSNRSIAEIIRPYLQKLGLHSLTFQTALEAQVEYATGYQDDGSPIENGRLQFPEFSAGASGTARDYLRFLQQLGYAYLPLGRAERELTSIDHSIAVNMLSTRDRSSQEFMGCNIGLGVFVAQARTNRIAIHQGANDGFRAISFYCFAGPDTGKGFVLLCNADNKGVPFLSKVSQLLIQHLGIDGVRTQEWPDPLQGLSKTQTIKQEEIVNRGYKEYLFDFFETDRPEEIVDRGPQDPLATFNRLVGARVLEVSNELFARAENLFSDHLPKFDPALYGNQGKIMDSWESVRHNYVPAHDPHDYLKLQLKSPARCRYVSLSTMYHFGNHSPVVSVEAIRADKTSFELLPKVSIEGHSLTRVDLGKLSDEFCAVIVRMYPDGGLSRLSLYDDSLPETEKKNFSPVHAARSEVFAEKIPHPKKPLAPPYDASPAVIERNWSRVKSGQWVDLASLAWGGKIIGASNEHYGPAFQILSPYPPLNMFDGSESARSRVKGHFETVDIQLARKLPIEKVVVYFTWYRNNSPYEFELQGRADPDGEWQILTPKFFAKPFAGNTIELESVNFNSRTPLSQLRAIVYPDGGINRLEAWARVESKD